MKENNSFKKGIVHGLPICFGYFSVAFAFGIFAVKSGLSVFQSIIISMTNVTSAGQLAAVPIITSGGLISELALTQFIINLRYALMSVSLSQKLSSGVTTLHRFIISFVNTDEVFAVALSNKLPLGRKYLYGLILTPYLGWSAGTAVGAIAGNILPNIVITSLGIAIYAMFVAIVTPEAKMNKSTLLCVLLSIVLSCGFYYLPILNKVPSGFVIIICAVIASAVFAFVFPIETEESEDEVIE